MPTIRPPSYEKIRPFLVQPAKDVIKVINATCPTISPSGVSFGCDRRPTVVPH